jgi:CTP synthase (UTP-ammonia lyase)
MHKQITIGLVGNYSASVPAHKAIPLALGRAADLLGMEVGFAWVSSEEISDAARVASFDGIWCVPGSPYRSMDGALRAIRFAREEGVPFLGTCGGFQHAVIEYARHALGWTDADHAETAPDAPRAVIHHLACELVEAAETLTPVPGSRLARAYDGKPFQEGYRCRFGLNPAFVDALVAGPMRAAAHGPQGDVRAVELDGHPFFVGTLFQPERVALKGRVPPVLLALLRTAMSRRSANDESR